MLKKLLFIGLILFMLVSRIQAQSSMPDKEFWLSFFGRVTQAEIDSNLLKLFVLVSSKNGCTGTVQNPNTGYSQNFTVAPNSVQKVFIPAAECYNRSDGDTVFISNKGLVVKTSDTATVYLGNYQEHSFDASGVLPRTSLGYEYKVATYANDRLSCFLVVATEDNTKISFTLSNPINDENTPQNIYNAHTPYQLVLNKGQTFLATGEALLNSTVKSENCKPIAVYSGNYCPYVPSTCKACDVLVEQMPPLNSWGNSFQTINTLDRNTDSRIIIISKDDSTKVSIKQNGQTQDVFVNTDEYLEFYSQKNGVEIVSDKKISVTQYAIGKECSGIGDPMMMWIVSAKQKLKTSIFAAIPSPFIAKHYLLVFVKKRFASQTMLDNQFIGSYFSSYPQDTSYSFARIEISPSTHILKNPDGFIAYVYGYDAGPLGTDESYGYCLNTSYQNLEDSFSLSNSSDTGSMLYFETTDSTQIYIPSDTIAVTRNIESEFNSITWQLNGQSFAVPQEQNQTQLSWSLPATKLILGENKLSMLIHRDCAVDTLSGKLWLKSAGISVSQTDTTIKLGSTISVIVNSELKGEVHWIANGQTMPLSGSNAKLSPTVTTTYQVYVTYGNYSTDTLSFTIIVLQPVYTNLNDTICSNQFYIFNNQSINKTGLYINKLSGANGCDSIVQLHLQINPIFDYYQTILVHWDSTYVYNGQELADGKYVFYYQTELGCDSTLHLQVTKMTGSNCPEISIPEYFTPNNDGINDFFVIDNLDCYPNATVEIFDRYSKKIVVYGNDIQGWDGSYLGTPMPTTDYWYVVHLPEIAKRYVGHFLLKR